MGLEQEQIRRTGSWFDVEEWWLGHVRLSREDSQAEARDG
jgi:hypothetical protein